MRFNNRICLLLPLNIFYLLVISLGIYSCKEKDPLSVHEEKDPQIISVPDDYESLQDAINSLSLEGGSINIKARTYYISKNIHINRSNVEIIGEPGVYIKLANHINQPVILIGSEDLTPNQVINNIKISNIEIDGNKSNQDTEIDPQRTWIRNNGIDIRMVNDLHITNINIHDARSGGIVASWNCNRIFIDQSIFHNNYFDGIALYASEDIVISNFSSYQNNAAGLSLDNKLKNVIFNCGFIKNNGDVGIFARNSENLTFSELYIISNASDGCFLSHNLPGANQGVKKLFFNSCQFLNNGRWGLWLASTTTDSPDNSVVSSLFSGNISGNIKVDIGGNLNQSGNILL